MVTCTTSPEWLHIGGMRYEKKILSTLIVPRLQSGDMSHAQSSIEPSGGGNYLTSHRSGTSFLTFTIITVYIAMSSRPIAPTDVCILCQKHSSTLSRCSRCRLALYCVRLLVACVSSPVCPIGAMTIHYNLESRMPGCVLEERALSFLHDSPRAPNHSPLQRHNGRAPPRTHFQTVCHTRSPHASDLGVRFYLAGVTDGRCADLHLARGAGAPVRGAECGESRQPERDVHDDTARRWVCTREVRPLH